MNNKILIITHTEDNFSIEKTTTFIEENGFEVIRFDVDLYPLKNKLTTIFENNQFKVFLENEKKIRIDEVSAVWYRRAYNIGRGLRDEMDKKFFSAAMGEIRATLFGFLESMPCYSLGKPSVYRRLDSKEEQLKKAHEIGFKIPKTCITNNPEEAKSFFKNLNSEMIGKMQSSFAIYEDDVENVMFTNVITKDNADDLDALIYCPMKFQERLEKKRELRITVIGKKIFSFEINSQKSEAAKVDWRKDGINMIEDWVPSKLPKEIEAKIHQLLDIYHVDYGAIDMILTPENEYYFIEINAAGEFFWLDNLTENNQISKAIADLLCNKIERRNNAFSI